MLAALVGLTACSVPNDGGASPAKKAADSTSETHMTPAAEGTAPAAASALTAPASAGGAHAGTAILGGSGPGATLAAGSPSAASAEPHPLGSANAAPATSALPAEARPLGSTGALPPVHPAPAPGPCPADMALVNGFCIDRYEAHLVTDAGGELAVHPHFKRPEPGVRYLARSAAGVFPQAYISRVEAKAACVAAGKRLCTRREWLRACRGNGAHRYPYGPRGERGRCNTGKLHLLREVFGEHPPGGWSYERHFNSPDLDQKPGFLARSGEHAGCASELGVHDMIGNLHEWVGDMVDGELVIRMSTEGVERRDQPWHEGNGVFMGGFFSTTSELGPGCYFTTIAHEPTYHDYSTGFRCCDSVDPPAAPGATDASQRDGG
ncbi:SUMF1/EgtB/PvdO family nonheme iron enzyme [Sorangium atrum]|uniref:SUMF1/EgtB/PvdO family nonheme iron enzyme n=1 Tax=Sorangium atrum TaxID=2995308 RepID=A0ABT5CDP9_9BACT|nr:SUMF1/EgtB/PvdO family nonheme iron enzyme [Sorangium aterium]MDC0683935.1 SUMF1/EgtB/PvdO family nonheme iron enzyme [Sorangium aterium]